MSGMQTAGLHGRMTPEEQLAGRMYLTAPGKDGEPGVPGQDGGYYSIAVTQPDTGTMQLSLTPSRADMPAVEPVTVTLPDGVPGRDGAPGKNGRTPVKGTDYYTEADKAEMVELVLAALPDAEEVGY